ADLRLDAGEHCRPPRDSRLTVGHGLCYPRPRCEQPSPSAYRRPARASLTVGLSGGHLYWSASPWASPAVGLYGGHPYWSAQVRTTLPHCPSRTVAKACWKSSASNLCVMTGEMSRPDWISTDISYQVSNIWRP